MASELRFSRLRWMSWSPAHFHAADQIEEDAPDLPSRRMGTATHAAILGGELIVYEGERTGNAWKHFKALVRGDDYVIFDGKRQGKAWQSAKEQADGRLIVSTEDVERANGARIRNLVALREGRRALTIVSAEEYERASECADAVRKHPIAGPLIGPETERELRWEVMGRKCGGRLDIIGDGRLAEVKTSAIAAPQWLTHQAMKMHYLAQLSWYEEGAKQNGYDVTARFIIGCEVRRPYPVTVMQPTDRAMELGARTVRAWMEQLHVCESSNEWREYALDVVPLDVPEEVDLIFADEEAA